jgi:hypothetical protein
MCLIGATKFYIVVSSASSSSEEDEIFSEGDDLEVEGQKDQ